jgi:UDP-glucuronate 4-epimerase
MRIAITGSAGFIGFHLARELAIAGHEVKGIDNFNNYYPSSLKKLRSTLLKNEFNVETRKLELTDKDSVEKFLDRFSPDYVVHLGAQAGVRLQLNEYGKYITSNIDGFFNVASYVRRATIPGFIYASSSSVYGDTSDKKLCEQVTLTKPSSFYGSTKLCNEVLATNLFKDGQTKAIGLRFFTVYGEYGRPDMAYFKMLSSLLKSEKFKVFGDGSVIRDFTYVADVVESIKRLISWSQNNGSSVNEIVNIGGGNPVSLNQLIKLVEKHSKSKLNLEYGETVSGDMKRTYACTEKLNSLIGWQPETTLDEGVSKFIQWAYEPEIMKNIVNRWSNN